MRNVIGDIRDKEGRANASDARDLPGDSFELVLPLFCQGVVVLIEVEFERFHHSDNFFFADLLAAAKCVLMRAVVKQRVRNQICAPD